MKIELNYLYYAYFFTGSESAKKNYKFLILSLKKTISKNCCPDYRNNVKITQFDKTNFKLISN